MLTDTHAHLYWEDFQEDFDEMIKRAISAGVSTIINVGVDVEKSQAALEQVQNTNWPPGMTVYSTIGIHPHEALRLAEFTPYSVTGLAQDKLSDIDVSIHEDIGKLEQIYLSNTTKVVAVGECGLDYMEVDEQIKKLQRQLFQAQINLAKKLKLPILVHCRDDRSKNPNNTEAWDEVVDLVKDHFGILHCYSGLPETTQKALKTNFLISFAGNLTYPKNDYLKEAAKIIPLDKIVLETDCPFLSPQSKRGQRNEPANLIEIVQGLAEIKGVSFVKIAQRTTANVQKFFKTFRI